MEARAVPARAAPARRAARLALAGAAAWACLGASGCRPSRVLYIDSIPPDAVVRLDETVIGRTPLEHRFDHFGTRRLSLYSPGYQTYSERIELDAPWHARFPVDLLTEVILPLGLDHRVELPVVFLVPDDGEEAEPASTVFVRKAGEVRAAARASQPAEGGAAPPGREEAAPESAAPGNEGEGSAPPESEPAPERPPPATPTPEGSGRGRR